MHVHVHEKKIAATLAIVALLAGVAVYAKRGPRPVPRDPSAVTAASPEGRVAGERTEDRSASPAGALEAGEGESRYRIGEGSKASFRINEVLRGTPYSVVGTTGDVEGDIVLDAERGKARIGAVAADARTLKTDDAMRDRMIAKAILRTEDPANAWLVFTPTSIDGLPASIVPGVPFDLAVTGDLTLAGTTRQVTFNAAAQLSGDVLVAKADTTVFHKDFGLTIPEVPFVAGVDDDLTITIDIVAVKG